MNREDGFPIADLDVGLFHDPKVIALSRRIRDEGQTATYVALYVALVLQSWEAGDRVTLDDALPAWWQGTADDCRAALQAVDLIDAESRLPIGAWTSWYIPAFNRREKRKESGAEGGRRSWQSRRDKRSRSDASPTLNPSDTPAVRPSDGQDRPVSRETIETYVLDTSGAATCPLCRKPTSVHSKGCPNALRVVAR
jgi:hypothetical protein